jgi:low temperature requirement protein LtrA
MTKIFGRRPAMTDELHRATSFEVFFDVVFVFAITRVISFMAHSLSLVTLTRGLLLLLLLWWSWAAYAWLGNQARADQGIVRVGMLIAMAAVFVSALVVPDAWGGNGPLNAPVVLAAAFAVVRLIYLGLFLLVAADDRRLRAQLLLDTIPQSLALVVLIVGAEAGGTVQTVLWATAFVIDFGGGRIASSFSGWNVRSASHFSERHGLVLIIALGEFLISIGSGTGFSISNVQVLVGSSLGFIVTVCFWWLYFAEAAAAGEQALAALSATSRAKMARDAYTLGHFPLIVGALYAALGTEEVLARLAADGAATAGRSLGWSAAVALYGGVALYLLGRTVFVRVTARAASAAPLVVAGIALALLPVAQRLPALAALGVVSALLVSLVGYEQLRPGLMSPAA